MFCVIVGSLDIKYICGVCVESSSLICRNQMVSAADPAQIRLRLGRRRRCIVGSWKLAALVIKLWACLIDVKRINEVCVRGPASLP